MVMFEKRRHILVPKEPRDTSAGNGTNPTAKPRLPVYCKAMMKAGMALRRQVFNQVRDPSDFDLQLDVVAQRAAELLLERGVFHVKLHFSSGQVTAWLLNDALRYRVYGKDEFLGADFCAAFPARPYTALATVPPAAIPHILGDFAKLRAQEEGLYLQAGSINIVNGQVGLVFTTGSTHYLNYADFLANSKSIFKLT